jgi:hypothetical protein
MRPRNSAPTCLVLLSTLSLLSALACTSSDDGSKTSPTATTPSTPAPVEKPASPTPQSSAPTPAAAPAALPAGELRFTAQDGWITETPTSSMRKAQFRLPGADGAADASLVVYFFGTGGGGGVEANLTRWAGQFEQADGSDSMKSLKSSKRALGNVPVTEADLSGTYVAETSPGSGVRVREEGWRMLASILEASSGTHYVKLVGPAATVARWEPSYRKFIDGTLP